MSEATPDVVEIDGLHLDVEQVVAVARGRARVVLAASAGERIARCRAVIERLVLEEVKVYGLTTGFGSKRDVFIDPSEARQLQRNLIMSHSCGVGRPLEEDQARATMLLRANTLARGVSGVRVQVVEALLAMLNLGIYPYIPEKGSLGASGDLCPLSHLALVLMGHPEGRVYKDVCDEPNSRGAFTTEDPWAKRFEPSTPELLAERFGFEPLELQAKEGLALNNGTQMMSAIGVLTLYDAEALVKTAEIACAASMEAVKGVVDAFDERLHAVRPFAGQVASAANFRRLLQGSDILDVELNVARITRVLRLLDEARDWLELDTSQDTTELEAQLISITEQLREIRNAPKETVANQADQIDAAELARLSPRQQQLRAFRLALAPIQATLQESYRTLLGLALEDDGLRGREAVISALNVLEKAVPNHPRVQDDYSLRCMPQVAGGVREILTHVRTNLTVEINSATDNPLIFPPPTVEGESLEAYAKRLTIPECIQAVSSGGNFHGEPVAFLMDYLCMGIAEIGNISERRTAKLTDGNVDNGLPSLLIRHSGLHSGFMIPQYTAAALVSENKILTHPASTDSIPSCENTEDHVSMGSIGARKAREVLVNVEQIVAIELLNANQALSFRRPLCPGPAVSALLNVLAEGGIEPVVVDRPLYPDIHRVCELLRSGALIPPVEAAVGTLL